MLHRYLRLIVSTTILFALTAHLEGQVCPDVYPQIYGPTSVRENQIPQVEYFTPIVPGHLYSWSLPDGGGLLGGTYSDANYTYQKITWSTIIGTVQDFRVQLSETYLGCTDNKTILVHVNPLLHAYFYYQYDPTGGCFFNLVNFTGDVSVHADPSITYSWNFGDPGSGVNNTSTLPNPNHTFTTWPTTFSVVLTITDSRGITDAITDYVYVNPDQYKPTAVIDAPALPPCLYDPVTFSGANSLAKPVTNPDPTVTMRYYIWNFDDPSTKFDTVLTSAPVTHLFSAPGTYHVTLRVVNKLYCTSDTSVDVVIQNSVPIANFTNNTPCFGTATIFTDASATFVGTITSWAWDFGDPLSGPNNTSALQNPTHTYTSASNFYPQLTVTNSNGCTNTYKPATPVTVVPSPVAKFNMGTACDGLAVTFTSTSTTAGGGAITTYQWNFNGTIVTGTTNPSFTFPSAGTFPVSLRVTNVNGCFNQKDSTVTVNPKPDVDFTYVGTIVAYQYTYTAIVNPTQFVSNNLVWDFGDGTSVGHGTIVTHTFPGAGTFTVTVTGTDMKTGCSNSASHQVTAGAPPSAFFTANPQNQCEGVPISFIAGPPGGVILTEHWDYHDGTFDDFVLNPPNPLCCPANPVHTFALPGPYQVTRTINAGTASEASWDVFGTIYPSPTSQFIWFSDLQETWQGHACADQPVFFKDESFSNSTPAGNIYKWSWDFGDPGSGAGNNTSQLQNPTHIFSGSAATYQVRLIVWDNLNNCPDTSAFVNVYVSPAIATDFQYNNFTCLDSLVNFTPNPPSLVDSSYTWLWDFGDGATSNTPGAVSHLYGSTGSWTVTLTLADKYGCSKSKQHSVVVIPLPIANFSFTDPTCEGDPIQFTDLSIPPPSYPDIIVSWSWDFGDGLGTSILQNPSYTYPGFAPAGYDVILTITTSRGCVAKKTQHVQPIPAPVANFEVLPQTPTCATQVVQFEDLSQEHGGGAIVTWHWDFGDLSSGANNTSPAQNPTHIFATAGTYWVTLKVINANGCDSTKKDTVVISALPVANFTAPDTCMGSPTIFTNTSTTSPPSTTIVSYSWDFGDGGTSNIANPQHTYATYGTKTVTLTVVNSKGCIGTVQKQVNIFAQPVAQFIYSPSTCLGNPVLYTDQSYVPGNFSGYIKTWQWDFGDGSVTPPINWPNSPNISHIFLGNATTHIVRLTVTTTSLCTSFIDHTITSIPSPLANFSYSNTNCLGQSIQFTDLSATNGGPLIQTWFWFFDDPLSGASGTSTLQNPSHTFAAAGTHYVKLTVTSANGCISTKDSVAVVVNLLPVSKFTYTQSCEGTGTQFTDVSLSNATSIISWLWDFGDGTATSPQQNPLHVYSTYGIKNVHLTITNDLGCIKDTFEQVTVNPKPIPGFSFTTPNCMGTVVHFYDQSSTVPGFVGPIITWVWHYGDGSPNDTIHAPGNPNVTHTFLGNATSHTVRLTVFTLNGCFAFLDQVVTSVPSPLANFGFPGTTCSQQQVQFTDLSQTNGGGTILQWHWNFGDAGSGSNNNSTTQNPIHLFSGPGTYTVTLIVTNTANCPSTKDTVVTILALPVSNFTADTACLGSVTTFTANNQGGTITAYSWNFGDGTTGSSQNTTHLYSSSGVFPVTLTVTAQNGCQKDSTKYVLVVPKPVALFTTSGATCAGDSVHFTDLSTAAHGYIRTWHWDFGDGQSTTITFPTPQNVTHYYATGNTYAVTLTITTSDSCTAAKTLQVLINGAPLANFSVANTRCALSPVAFTDLSQTNSGSAITQWLWNFGDPNSGTANTSSLRSPSHSFSSASTGAGFHVKLTVTNANGCFDSVSQNVTVNGLPVAKFTSDTACVGTATHFHDTSVTPTGTTISAWLWDFGDGASGTNNNSTLQNPSHTFSTTGLFQVMLTVTNSNSCTHDTIIPVDVKPKPTAMFSASSACVGDSTSFTDLSVAPGSAISAWLWHFGDGGSSTLQNPQHAYANSGVFNVTLTVTNLSGCQDSITIPITARPKPISAFTYTSYFCPAGTVNFENQSQGVGAAITNYNWIFEPGYTSILPNPTYTFPVTDTTYMVSLIVTDNFGCKDTITDSVHVKPGFRFTFTNDTVCFNKPTHFRPVNQATGDTLYNPNWDFGDPNSFAANHSTLYNPTHVFTTPGVYAVKLRVVNSDNCVDSVYKNVTVYKLPVPTFSFVSAPCDSVIHFSDMSLAGSGSITSWIWAYGDGSIDTILAPGPGNTSHLYTGAQPSSYDVILTINNSNGCSDTVSQMVESYPCLVASFTHADTLICARYPIVFSDSSLPVSRISQWHWIFGDGVDTTYTTHLNGVTHRYTDGGSYLVKLVVTATISGRTFNDTMSRVVIIHPTPLAQFANPNVCLNQVTLFTDTTATYGAKLISWKWTFGDPPSGILDTSFVKNPSHKYDTTGSYDIKLIVMNKFGCKDSLTKTSKVFGIPVADFLSSRACEGNPTYFTDKSKVADTSFSAWHWSFGELTSHRDTSLLENPYHQYSKAGTYAVRLIVKDMNGCYDTADSSIVVNVTPTSAFTVTEMVNNMIGKIKLNNQTQNADSYYWDFGDPSIPGSTDENPLVTYSHDGTYLITLVSTNSYHCSDTSYFKYEVLFKGLYIPNAFAPTSGVLGVSAFKPVGVNIKVGTYQIEIFDIWGHLLWSSKEVDTDGHPVESWNGNDPNGNPCPAGTYMWKVSATFIDGTTWEGGDIGKGSYKTIGTVTLIR